jgi:hypothetical protein
MENCRDITVFSLYIKCYRGLSIQCFAGELWKFAIHESVALNVIAHLVDGSRAIVARAGLDAAVASDALPAVCGLLAGSVW